MKIRWILMVFSEAQNHCAPIFTILFFFSVLITKSDFQGIIVLIFPLPKCVDTLISNKLKMSCLLTTLKKCTHSSSGCLVDDIARRWRDRQQSDSTNRTKQNVRTAASASNLVTLVSHKTSRPAPRARLLVYLEVAGCLCSVDRTAHRDYGRAALCFFAAIGLSWMTSSGLTHEKEKRRI